MVKFARRELVAASLAALAASIAPVLGRPTTRTAAPPWLPAELLGGNLAGLGHHLLADPDVRRQLPAGRVALEAALHRRLGYVSGAAVPPALKARIRTDFAVGDTVMASGWVLSRTEVMLCCLAARGVAPA